MSLLKLAIPAITLVSGAYAQCSTSGTLTLTNSADASGLASCRTYSGSIAVATGATDISIPVSRITGDLVADGGDNGMLTSFSAPSLQIVGGQVSITRQPSISTLSMPELAEADSFVLDSDGPNLLTLNMGTPGLTRVNNLSVTDTFLQNIDGIDPMMATQITIASNTLLQSLTMQVMNVTGIFSIRGNAQGLTVSLPNLSTAGEVQINDCSSLMIPSLSNVTQTVAFNDNSFQSLVLPNLTLIGPGGGGFNVVGNSALTNLTVPELSRVAGGVVVANNTKLGGTVSLPNLLLAGSGQFSGGFQNVAMPKLSRMGGTLVLQSTENIQSTCSHFSSLGNGGAIAGGVTCRSAQASTSASSSSPSSTSTSNAGYRYGTSAETVFSVFGGLAALFGLFM